MSKLNYNPKTSIQLKSNDIVSDIKLTTFLSRCSDCTTATLQGSHSVASSYGFSETDETITAETMTPNQLTLQAISTDEEDCIVDELVRDPISVTRLSREVRDSEYHTQENASISSDNESCNSIPLENPDSHTGKKVH